MDDLGRGSEARAAMKSPSETAEFQRILHETGSYRTDPARLPSRMDRMFGRFDTWYYLKLARILYLGHRAVIRGEFDTKVWAAHSLAFLSALEDIGATLDISGVEHPVKLGRPAVFIGNHMSMLESFLLPAILLHVDHIAAVIKKGLLKYPFVSSIARASDPICVGRRNPKEDLRTVLDDGKKALSGGRSVVLFPQATRSAAFDPASFNTLGVKLAKSAGAPVIPLALKTDFQRNGSIIKDIGPLDRSKTIYFKFGEPLAVTGTGKDANERVARFIADSLREWGGEVLEPKTRETQ
ncbi:lysophospholipid acyltransferase family protein [Elusimicrobiota bacterium]